jgi:carbamoyl-phosphate synthase small subunit|tara:strand:+ start:1379 stop:2485 length:1107 start_codon:yes stop_codon:yes gene_type:complete
MNNPAFLILQDGSIYHGSPFGYDVESTFGEVVFNTSMTGYQEMLTDPSYAGQIVVPTYPLIGNYGISEYSNESNKIQVSGLVVRQHCLEPSHTDSVQTISDFLKSQKIPGISEIDTRAVTRRIRENGVMMGGIAIGISEKDAINILKKTPQYDELNYVNKVSTKKYYAWDVGVKDSNLEPPKLKILVSDFGLKYNILRILRTKGCQVEVFPSNTTAQELLERNPSGIMLSPGPGNPELLDYTANMAKELLGRVPIMGICMGNQVLGKALGGKTYKLKFGHRGSNHPVKEISTDRIHITSQNHGYSIDADSLPQEVEVTHISMNDSTVEGLRHKSLPAMSIQYHSEASPGPKDNEYIFDKFLDMVKESG